MTARNIAEIIHFNSHTRTVEFKQSEEAARPSHKEHQPDPEQLKAAAGVINRLFAELQSCFPAWRQTFTSKSDIDSAKRVWARGLIEAKITSDRQLQWGLAKARRSESAFWPSIGQFIKWCKPDPEDFGLPSPEQAFREASRNSHPVAANSRWSHPAVYVAAREVGAFELSNLPRDKSWPLFERAYSIVVQRVLNGENLDSQIPKALPERPAARPADPAVARRHIERLKNMLARGS